MENGASLKGVKSFDGSAGKSNWINMERDGAQFSTNLKDAFQLALRRDGVIVDSAAPNYLYCDVQVGRRDSLIFFSWSVRFFDFSNGGLNTLLWKAAGIGSAGSNNFNHEVISKACADAFAFEWLKQNPK